MRNNENVGSRQAGAFFQEFHMPGCSGFLWSILWALLILCGTAVTAQAQQNDTALPAVIQQTLQNGKAGGEKLVHAAALQDFYQERDFAPLWMVPRRGYAAAQQAHHLLRSSWTHGLNPEHYHVAALEALLETDNAAQYPALELLLSDAIVRYGRDLSGMRIRAADLRLGAQYWRQRLDADIVLAALVAAKTPLEAAQDFAPKGRLYDLLRAELVRLSAEESNYEHLLPFNFGTHHFTPRSKHREVEKLRIRLGVPYRDGADKTLYDDDLASAVMAFQKENGLVPDGIIGPQTISVLNRGKKAKMKQIVANLERLRWLDDARPERYLLVNIPSQQLWAVENGEIVEQMDVIVGLPYRQTKSFTTLVTGIRFNPTWTVPQRLKMEDFLPRLKENPGYLYDKGMEVIRGHGREAVTLDPYSIDWHSISAAEMGQIRMVQSPGDHNALGRIRVLMPNPYNIYLHDTNHPEYFDRTPRFLSSGCIRLSKPETIARFVLKNRPDWSDEKMNETIRRGRMTDIGIDETLPVYILYQTIWLEDDGRLVYGSDAYRQDQNLLGLLSAMAGYYLPTGPDQLYAERSGRNQPAVQ